MFPFPLPQRCSCGEWGSWNRLFPTFRKMTIKEERSRIYRAPVGRFGSWGVWGNIAAGTAVGVFTAYMAMQVFDMSCKLGGLQNNYRIKIDW